MTVVHQSAEAAQVGLRVQEEMRRCNVRQDVVGQRLGLSQSATSRRLLGEVPFNVAELAVVAALLDVPLADLVIAAERVA